MNLSKTDADILLNSLRNGIAPDRNAEFIFKSRVNELNEFNRVLDLVKEGFGAVKFVSGEYGSGKTSFIKTFSENALNKGFIISNLRIDKGFRMNSIEDLYYYIMHNLFIYDKSVKKIFFEELFDIWIENLKSNPNKSSASVEINHLINELNVYNASFSRAFLAYIRAKIKGENQFANVISSWLSGEKNIPSELKSKFDVIGGIDSLNSMDFLKAFIRLIELMDYKGLIIVIDELDLIINERIDVRKKILSNIKHIFDAVTSGELSRSFFVFSGESSLFTDFENGVALDEALSQRIGGINKNRRELKNFKSPVLFLNHLSIEDFHDIADGIISIYKTVYGFDPIISNKSYVSWSLIDYKKVGKKFSDITPRDFIKKIIEILDISSQNDKINIFNTEMLLEIKEDEMFFTNKGAS